MAGSGDIEHIDAQQLTRDVATRLGDRRPTTAQVKAAMELLDAGNTIPFIARYRKEATQGLDEIALRAIEDAYQSARELRDRKATVLKTIEQQGLLTAELRQQIERCADKHTLEELYLPFKPKRRTRATIARERGLEPLAEILLKQQPLNRPKQDVLRAYVDESRDVPTEAAALSGAGDIVAEVWSDQLETRRYVLEQSQQGYIVSQVKRGKRDENSKFVAYFDHREPLRRVPSHRFLAMQRGAAEGLLNVGIELDADTVLPALKRQLVFNDRFEFRQELLAIVEDAYERLLLPATESTVLSQLKAKAEEEAIQVFASNLRELLLAPPAGPRVTLGIDPGFRTGCKLALVDGTGKLLAHTAIYPTPPRSDTTGAAAILDQWLAKYGIELIAIGNGTASRETDQFVTQWLRERQLSVTKVVVSEAGASVYSASEIAGQEYPDLDLTVRGAISIAHRLQDPLAELVKIDPKSIGVGQYQHDVNQTALRKSLDREVESCVNSVGVDVNLASASLLSYVAGIGPKLAERIVEYRNDAGRFQTRQELLQVPKLGQKAFEQAAGFLRIRDGKHPLDNSAVHPERYEVVERMARSLHVPTTQLVGNATLAAKLQAREFVDANCGLPTIDDILTELAKPGRDPRREFKVARFTDAVCELNDLRPGMILEGCVTNVTRFGAFVDIGVHQDGLVHISELANTYVNDPSEVVAVGDVVRVKVLEVDQARKRIALSRKQCL